MYKVQVNNNGGSIFRVKSKDYEFAIDTEGKGVTPPEALLASLGSCIGVYLKKYLQGAKLVPEGFDITVEAEFSKEPPMKFQEINVSIDLKGLELDGRRREALLGFIRNCPVHNTLKGSPSIEVNLI
jgi:uncharacterized OsmC-like protein